MSRVRPRRRCTEIASPRSPFACHPALHTMGPPVLLNSIIVTPGSLHAPRHSPSIRSRLHPPIAPRANKTVQMFSLVQSSVGGGAKKKPAGAPFPAPGAPRGPSLSVQSVGMLAPLLLCLLHSVVSLSLRRSPILAPVRAPRVLPYLAATQPLNLAVFSARPYMRTQMECWSAKFSSVKMIEASLSPVTASLANGCDAVSVRTHAYTHTRTQSSLRSVFARTPTLIHAHTQSSPVGSRSAPLSMTTVVRRHWRRSRRAASAASRCGALAMTGSTSRWQKVSG